MPYYLRHSLNRKIMQKIVQNSIILFWVICLLFLQFSQAYAGIHQMNSNDVLIPTKTHFSTSTPHYQSNKVAFENPNYFLFEWTESFDSEPSEELGLDSDFLNDLFHFAHYYCSNNIKLQAFIQQQHFLSLEAPVSNSRIKLFSRFCNFRI